MLNYFIVLKAKTMKIKMYHSDLIVLYSGMILPYENFKKETLNLCHLSTPIQCVTSPRTTDNLIDLLN